MNDTTIYCDNCGKANRIQAKFCFGCGQPMVTALSLAQSSTRVLADADSQEADSTTGLFLSNHILNKRYHIIEQVGKGGMGAVYKAKDSSLGDRLVAIKEMGQDGLSSQDIASATEAFKMEALMLARLKHPCLPSIYDHFYENAHWYLVMDFIEGETLEGYLRKNNRNLPIREILRIGEQICLILEYLHEQQPPIIFRDLKPANVMLTANGHLYLIDFGIARVFKPGQAKDTIALGSPGYAAPEQYGRAQTTTRSDIYSLGAILYQMVTGRDPSLSPFSFPSIQPVNAFTKLIMQMVESDPNKRPDNIVVVKKIIQVYIKALNALPPSASKSSQIFTIATPREKTLNPAPVSRQFHGKGQQISPQFTLTSGIAIFRMKHSGKRNFIISLLDGEGRRFPSIVNKVGDFDGAHALRIERTGNYILNIQADGKWTVNIDQQIGQLTLLLAIFKGSGQQISSPFKLTQGLVTFHMKHNGRRNFIISLLDNEGRRLPSIVNKVGNFDGAYALGIKQSGIYLLTIQADGNWAVAIQQ